jgi:hypothetical protein
MTLFERAVIEIGYGRVGVQKRLPRITARIQRPHNGLLDLGKRLVAAVHDIVISINPIDRYSDIVNPRIHHSLRDPFGHQAAIGSQIACQSRLRFNIGR